MRYKIRNFYILNIIVRFLKSNPSSFIDKIAKESGFSSKYFTILWYHKVRKW